MEGKNRPHPEKLGTEMVRPEVEVELGGKVRRLRMDLNAMCCFQEVTGKNLFDSEVASSISRGMTPADLRALLWACLVHEDKKLTIEQVGGWIGSDNMLEVAQGLSGAFANSMPPPEDTDPKG